MFPRALLLLVSACALLSACLPEFGNKNGKEKVERVAVPIQVSAPATQARSAAPATFGVPLAEGVWQDGENLVLEWTDGTKSAAGARPLAWWEDGSWSFAEIEFFAPALLAGETRSGQLVHDENGPSFAGTLDLVLGDDKEILFFDNGWFQLQVTTDQTALFSWTGGLTGPMFASFQSQAGDFTPVQSVVGPLLLDRMTGASTTVRRDLSILDAKGRKVATLETRITLWRGHRAVRIRHSLDIHLGRHKVQTWELLLPTTANAARVGLASGGEIQRNSPARILQVAEDLWNDGSTNGNGSLPGILALDNIALEISHFSSFHPNGIALDSAGLHLELVADPGDLGRTEILLEGFGRTREVWILAAADPNATLAQLSADMGQTSGGPDPASSIGSEAFGPLRPNSPDASRNSPDAAIEAGLSASIATLLDRRTRLPQLERGFRHFGDYTSTMNSVSYWGAMQGEYDPAMVLLLQGLRTASPEVRKLGLEAAWHYSDVDLAPWGGAFQHRATRHAAETFISSLLVAGLEAQLPGGSVQGDPQAILEWLDAQWEPGFADELQGWLDEEAERGLSGEALRRRALTMVAMNEVLRAENAATNPGNMDMESFVRGIAADARIQALGFVNVDSAFAPFFADHGGSWDQFPSFHVDPHPIPILRHSGGHGVIQGVVLAYLLTGEERFRQVALRFAQHQVKHVVPRAIHKLEEDRITGQGGLYTRTVAWPLLNLTTLHLLTRNAPGLNSLDRQILQAAQSCVNTLALAPANRYRSTIHAGVAMEALADWHALTADPLAMTTLLDLAHHWVDNQYDTASQSFRHLPGQTGPGNSAMSGLCVYGLSYAAMFDSDPSLRDALLNSWAGLVDVSGYGKSLAMRYRGSPRVLDRIRILRGTLN